MSGVPVTIPNLPSVTPDTPDSVVVYDSSAGLTGRSPISGLGNIFALLSGAVFTGDLTAPRHLSVATDLGTSPGAIIRLERNTNATTAAPGSVVIRQANNVAAALWPDNSAIWRTSPLASGVTSGDISSGTVVGSQSSSLDVKDVLGEALDAVDVLALVAEGAAAVRRFVYKAPVWPVVDDDGNLTGEEITGERPNGGEEYSGVIVDYAGRYGTDRDDAHPNGKSLNTINAIGDLLIAVTYLSEQLAVALLRIEALELAGEVGT